MDWNVSCRLCFVSWTLQLLYFLIFLNRFIQSRFKTYTYIVAHTNTHKLWQPHTHTRKKKNLVCNSPKTKQTNVDSISLTHKGYNSPIVRLCQLMHFNEDGRLTLMWGGDKSYLLFQLGALCSGWYCNVSNKEICG